MLLSLQSAFCDVSRGAFSALRVAMSAISKKLGVGSMGNLLHWAVVFLVVALVAAFFGFGGVAGTAMEGARILFWVAIVFLIVSLVLGFIRRA